MTLKAKAVEPIDQFALASDNNSYLDKLDKHKKRFVDLYTQLNGHITNTCAAMPIARQTYYTWLETDENFANAVAESEWQLNDEIRDVLINKAASGDMTGVIFYLKSRHPDFKPQPNVLIQQNFGKHIEEELKNYE